MKVGDLVAYAWNAKERPDDIEIAIVVDVNPPHQCPGALDSYIQIQLQSVYMGFDRPLCVPRFKLDVISEAR